MEQLGFHDMRSLLQQPATPQSLERLERMLTQAHAAQPGRVKDEWWPYARSIIARSWPPNLVASPLPHALTSYEWPGVEAVLVSFHEIDARASGRTGRLRPGAKNNWRALIAQTLDAQPESQRDLEGLISALFKRLEGEKASKQIPVVEVLGCMGGCVSAWGESLLALTEHKDKKLRKVAFEAIGEVGGELEWYEQALLAGLDSGDKLVGAAFASMPDEAGDIIRSVLSSGTKKARRAAYEAMVAFAPRMRAQEWSEDILEVLEAETEAVQKLGLEMVIGLERPPRSLLESVADLSSLAGASRALRKFEYEPLRRELPSLLKSGLASERLVGLEIVKLHGARAEEHAPTIAQMLTQPYERETNLSAITWLEGMLGGEELASALQPALDHWDEQVQQRARAILDQANVPVRASKWEGHPFSPALLRQLIRLGFEPKEGGFAMMPEHRPLPELPMEEGQSERPEQWEGVQLSAPIWTLLHGLIGPPYTLYTVWGSYENADTFYFSSEPSLYARALSKGGELAPMYVIGDGSIGYFAALDLRDKSDDPALYYMERWGGWGNEASWRVAHSLSSYLRQLGER